MKAKKAWKKPALRPLSLQQSTLVASLLQDGSSAETGKELRALIAQRPHDDGADEQERDGGDNAGG